MYPTVLAALIGLAGAVAGAVITAYGRELGHAALGRKDRDADLVSEWDCTWYNTTDDGGEVLGIRDVVNIKSVRDGRIKGIGVNIDSGEYVLEGTVSQSNVVTVVLRCTGKRNLTGVAILQLDVLRTKMDGQWLQYGAGATFFGGRTAWKKRPH